MWRIAIAVSALIAVCLVDAQNPLRSNFAIAYGSCFKRENLTPDYSSKFRHFVYPDTSAVHRFLHCLWSNLGFWDDSTGFDVQAVAQAYKDKANTEVLIPILSACNTNNTANNPPLRWCYTAFLCILNSRVGQWYKDDVRSTW